MLTTRSTSSRAARPFAAGSAAGVTLRIGLTVCLGIAGSLSLAATARADNGQIAAAQAKVAEYERTSAEASDRAAQTRAELRTAQQDFDEANRLLSQAQDHLREQQGDLARMARQMYVSGGSDSAVAAWALDANSNELLHDLDRLSAAGDAHNTTLRRAREAAEAVQRAEQAKAARRDELTQLAEQLEGEREQARAAMAAAQAELNTLQEEERRRVEEELARQREAERIAAEKAAAEEAARQAAAAEAARRAEEEARAAEERAAQQRYAAAVAAQAAAEEAARQAAAQQEAARAEQAAAAAAQAREEQRQGLIALAQLDRLAQAMAAQQQQATQQTQAPAPAVPQAPVPAAAPAQTSSTPSSGGGDFAASAAWASGAYQLAIRMCESTNNYSINTGNGYYGAWQFDYPSWHANGGGQFAEYPHQATPAQQDFVAYTYWLRAGWGPWECALKIGRPA